MMTLLSTAHYIPASIAGLVFIFLSVKFILLPVADLVNTIRDRTTQIAIFPLTVFLFLPALSIFFVAVTFTVCMSGYMLGLVH
ncbi:TPA: hypothetical protein ACMEXA_005627 [Klebsiella variicola subsp. variicola]|jgi:hypothetical protein|uniref:hypothetical protein n=1 Tax=Klebsiella variicola TaxID=244366 RepID=UPI001CCC22E1|nr:hypothetical protein [Klebsiella variicola]HBQ8857483.1 hypothetical protein [Klebsiella variicola subsp. variicola]HBQ8869324.1 hypothetical protein [Klebsiella pneumoniae]MEC5999715.1 hypothetical protein [Klebsiella variicola]UBN00591.1 hypothetical protein LB484_29450 [Klebsiella variicola]HBQ8863791.1 hypothetical protein [Klebsiella variicola subsp. variicola]